jgi:pimeloyl-ACP methyl ester carboxylesterase
MKIMLRAGRIAGRLACATLLLGASQAARSQGSQPARPAPPGTLVNLGGYRVHLDCTGKGSPTVMIAGAAFSFDWGLIQPELAKFTRVCTFDPSGTAWSDSFQAAVRALDPSAAPDSPPTCEDRVHEIHRLTTRVPIDGPTVLVGYSAGALWARLYAAQYPKGIVGIVIVDHAFLPAAQAASPRRPPGARATAQGYTPPVLISQTPIVFGFEDDANFRRLPRRDREFHAWAVARHPVRPGQAMVEDCLSQIRRATEDRADPLGDIPLAVISTPNQSPGYAQLQSRLLALSHESRQFVAQHSSHMVLIDEPEAVVKAIRWTVETARSRGADLKPRQ